MTVGKKPTCSREPCLRSQNELSVKIDSMFVQSAWVSALAGLWMASSCHSLPHKPPPGPIDWVVEFLDRKGSSAFLFRGDLPEKTDTTFNYAGVLDIARTKTSGLPKSNDDIFLIDCSFTYSSWPDKPEWVVAERTFFEKNTSLGEFHHWPLYGDWRDPNDYSASEKERDAKTLAQWQTDELVNRVQQIHTWMTTGPPVGKKALVIYFHCETGVDRTGEFAVSYGLRYLNQTFQDAMKHSDALCTKVNGRPVMPMMAFAAEWYCWWMYYVHGETGLECHLPDTGRKH
jgi:hypothetical protein